MLSARQQIDDAITDKTKRIDVKENATNALNYLLYELRGYELVDLRPLMQQEKLKKKYDAYSYLEALTDALPVEWIGGEVSSNKFGSLYYCAICKEKGRFFLFETDVYDPNYIDLDTGCEFDFRPILESYLSEVIAFRTKEDALALLKHKYDGTGLMCYKNIMKRLQ